MEPFVRSAYNYDMNQASDESGLECKDPTLTQQHFKDEVDINTLVERFGLTGEMPQVAKLPSFDDYTGIFDFQTAQNAIVAAREQFMLLPAKVRSRFENDPHQYVNFFADEANRDEAIRMGLIAKPADPILETTLTVAAVKQSTGQTQGKQGDTPKTTPKE